MAFQSGPVESATTVKAKRMPYEMGMARARVAKQLDMAADYRRRGKIAEACQYARLARMNNSFVPASAVFGGRA
jgi:hypothetical protein